ncbi:Acetyltransferase (GNAT) domain-containing protein [Seinonella peptonophila]|uniref:Acetyltransferase (GNAT) domain-containing protein n=1 Tax=Seinonella peptonophila TaxID=112248 RepID=A0A1M4Y6C2_9BACL|nr:GNAT family N-acetyltransferase [Seinonella peptonophila]SHF01255.1 Acetyltransferase (GNAT) domain-containing protein [Seinonella peptonophila]
MKFREIKASDTYALRQKVLRPHLPIEENYYDDDHHAETLHMGAFIEGKLVSIVSLYHRSHAQLTSQKAFLLRGMATAVDYRWQGIGSKLIGKGIAILADRNADLIWCNGRVASKPYYLKMGFRAWGNVFENAHGIPHIVMYKYLE